VKQLDAAQTWLSKQRVVWESRFDGLDALLEEHEDG
jgi:hypothetical protein